MAGTLSSEVIDQFLSRVKDYRLTSIFQASGSLVLTSFAEPWLIDAIVEFTPICDQDLTYTTSSSVTEGFFNQTLSLENKTILSQLMIKGWMAQTIQDILQLQNFVTDKDFKTFSAAQNLKSKQDYYNVKVEELDLILGKYAQRRINFTDWNNQIFD